MTESAGGTAPEKTVTIDDLCDRWELDRAEAPALQKFMGQDGPWTEAEAEELDRRMKSLEPEDHFPGFGGPSVIFHFTEEVPTGPHGPGCECGDLTPEEQAAAEELAARFVPLLAEALGITTPAEQRTGVADVEGAILGELEAIRTASQEYGKHTGQLGVATANLRTNPLQAAMLMRDATIQATAQAQRVEEAISRISSWLPRVRGVQAVDNEGEPLYISADNTDVRALRGGPQEDWRPLYVHG